jgi:hypothetical protein
LSECGDIVVECDKQMEYGEFPGKWSDYDW